MAPRAWFVALLLAFTAVTRVMAQENAPQTAYIVGPQDVLAITTWNQPALSGKFPVEVDGGFTLPPLGKVQAAGLSLHQVQEELKKRLKDGYLIDPQVTVTVDEYRSQRVFVIGEVRDPGPYQITGPTTLIELLAKAKSTTTSAGKEVLIVRPATPKAASGPLMPDDAKASDTIRVDLRALQDGDLSNNVMLQDGDTIFVPRSETVYVVGQVRSPGVLAIGKDTTVLQVLALAGGITDRGAQGRLRVIRLVNGKKKEIKIDLDDVVKADDTIVVPERFF